MSWLRLMEETIKENESAPVSESEELPHPPLPARKHSVGRLIKDTWPAYLIEIIVIILGISITLALEEWRDNSRENHLEQIYLKNLLSDVEVDLDLLKGVSASTQRILEKGNELLGFARNPENKGISDEQVNTDVRALLGRPK